MMTQRIKLEPAFVLHRRPFSNSSLLLELFSQHHGRLSAIARGARGAKSRYRGKLEPFCLLLVDWSGRSDLKTLGAVECAGNPVLLEADALVCGLYINELLVRLLHSHDAHSYLFQYYQQTITNLNKPDLLEKTLRCFEKQLLKELGYGLSLNKELHSNQSINAQHYYRYTAEQGFIACPKSTEATVFSGESLLALEQESFSTRQTLADAKRLMRIALKQRLGEKPLKSRELMLCQ